jgi:hypothetical protein
MPCLKRIHPDGTGNTANGFSPAYDGRNTLLIDTVLQRHHEPARGEILLDHHGGPLGIVGFGADEGNVDWGFEQALHFVQMQGFDAYYMIALCAAQVQPIVLDIFDMLRPGINERDVFLTVRVHPHSPNRSSAHKDKTFPLCTLL